MQTGMTNAAPVESKTRGLVAALIVMAVAAAGSWWGGNRAAEAFQSFDESHRWLFELEATLAHAVSIQSGARGFALTGDEKYLSPFESGLLGIQHSIARLKEMAADNQAQRSRLIRLTSLVDEEVSIMRQRLAARRAGGLVAASTASADGRGKKVVDAIRGLVATMQNEARGQLETDKRAMRNGALLSAAIAMAGFAVAGGLVARVCLRMRRR